jgi:protocatechuate 3,4-dioxygenase beta subunit
MEKTATDDDGYFIVSGIKAGPYAVMVDAQGYLKIDEKPIQAGEKDLEFTLESQGRVYITVIDKNNRPLPNYHVNLKAAFEGQDRYGNAIVKKPVRGAKDGTVLVAGVNPMTYVAEIYASGHAKKFSERFTITEAQTEPPRITVNLDTGGTIAGVVTDMKGKPISGITVITRPDGMIDNPFLQIFQVPYTITKRSGKTNKNGQFRFELMNPGKYQLKLSSKDYCAVYVQGIEVAIGQVAESNDIQMTRGCSISGITKVNGQPTGQVKVNISAVRSKDSPTPFSAEAISDNEGRFLLNKRLKPGKYEVMAAEQVQANPLLMMVQFSKSKQEIVIPQGSDHREIDVNISK